MSDRMLERSLKFIILLLALILLAILVIPFTATAQTLIYRSIKNTTASLSSVGGTISISGSTATFSVPQPDSIGVGQCIEVDIDNDTDIDASDQVVFIHGRTSSTVFTIKTSTGAAPTATAAATTVWAIHHAYTTLANWEAGTENTGIDVDLRAFDAGNRNISTNTEQWHIAIYNGSAGTLDVNGWTTGTTDNGYYVRFFCPTLTSDVGVTQRHAGVFTTNRGHITSTTTSGLIQTGSQYRFEGVQFTATTNYSINWISGAKCFMYVDQCIFKAGAVGIYVQSGAAGGALSVKNSLFYDQTSGTNDAGIFQGTTNTTTTVLNCTFATLKYGINQSSGTVILKNSLGKCDGNDFHGSYDASSNYNATADGTAPGANSRTSQTFTFVDEAGDNYNLAAGDAGALNYGTDLSGSGVTVDIVGTARPVGAAFDIGCFESTAGATVSPTLLRRRNPVQ